MEEILALPRLGGRAGAYAASVLAPFRFDDITVVPPTRTLAGLAVDVGGREVELIEVGPAHTAGDVLVHVPDARVMFAGTSCSSTARRSCGRPAATVGGRV